MRGAVLVVVVVVAIGAHAQAPLRVAVEPSGVEIELVRETCAEADAIWKRAGVAIDWRFDRGEADVRVVFSDPPRTSDDGSLTLGWLVFNADVPDPIVHLSISNMKRLLDVSTEVLGSLQTMKRWQREELVARGLGRALAHELGHFLLSSKRHTPNGLMRAQHTGAEMFEPGRLPFAIDPQLRAAAATQIAALTTRR
jgi:hypothetical protein